MGDPETQEILAEIKGRVGIITLNRPDVLNAMNGSMQGELMRQMRAWNDDDSVGAMVITGAGRGFCSGADISGFERTAQGNGPPGGSELLAEASWTNLVRESKPIVCAINGVAVGVGITMTLPCDVRVAAEGARMSFRFVKIGVTPEYGSTHYLPRLVGLGHTLELMLTGRFVQAEEAASVGLVNHVFPAEALMDEAVSLARDIADGPAWHLGKVKRLVHENYMEKDMGWVLRREREAFRESQSTEEHREALTAFREQRQPRFH